MTYDQLIQHFGSAAEAARVLGYEHRQHVQKWKAGGIPREKQALIEIVTGGQLVADIAPAERAEGPPSKIPGPVEGGGRPSSHCSEDSGAAHVPVEIGGDA